MFRLGLIAAPIESAVEEPYGRGFLYFVGDCTCRGEYVIEPCTGRPVCKNWWEWSCWGSWAVKEGLEGGRKEGHWPVQYTSGRFVKVGSAYIQEVERSRYKPAREIYFDGVLIDPDTWKGTPNNQPKTWKANGDFEVLLSEGQWFALFTPRVEASYVQERDADVVESDESVTSPLLVDACWEYIVNGKDYWFSAEAGTLHYAAREQVWIELRMPVGYEVVSLIEVTPDPSQGEYYCDPDEPLRSPPIYPMQICVASRSGEFSVLRDRVSSPLFSDPGLSYFPTPMIEGELMYTTPPTEADRIRALGLEPIDFTVKVGSP